MHQQASTASQQQPPARHTSAWLDAAWASHQRWVPAVLRAHMPRDAEIDDLAQEVALQVVRRGHEVRDPEAFPGWLRTVAMNVARLAGRKRTFGIARLLRPLGEGEAERLPAREAVAASEHTQRVHQLLDRLPEEYREAVLLKSVHGMSYREIGLVLGLPESTVETRVCRGRNKLRELARNHADEDAGLREVLADHR